MKKLSCLLLIAVCSINVYSQTWIKTAVFQNNIWYPWEDSSNVKQSGSYNQFVVHSLYDDPSRFYFRVTIDNFYIPDKNNRKAHIKSGEWYVFSGTIEYWIDDDHMDFLSCLPSYKKSVPIEAVPWHKYDGRPSIIKKSPATIQIAPYEKFPQTYNVWFEGIGYAFYFFEKY